MFIYLDHAHFVALDTLLRRDPAAFGEFLDFWLRYGCRLVVSRAHLHEIGQCAEDEGVERRLEVLRYFALWSGDENVDWVMIREILHQTSNRLRADPDPPTAPYRPLRDEIYRRVEHDVLREFVHRFRPGLLDEMRARKRLADFENSSRRLKDLYRRLSGKKKPGWKPDVGRMLPVARKRRPPVGGDPVADRWMTEVDARAADCYENAKRERHALICMYGLEGLSSVERAPVQDLSRLGFLRALGKHWAVPYFRQQGYDPAAVKAALDDFDPYDAPAISASLAVERGRKGNEKAWEAGDFMDVDHVLWAAHTDLAFVDKRTHEFLDQARRNPRTVELLSPHLAVSFQRTTNLHDVMKHIGKRAEERSRDAPSS